jgi:hypothetical protein
MSAISHSKSLTMADFTGTVTVFNSAGNTTSIAATDLVRPSDFNSAHNVFLTISGNTLGTSTVSGTNIVLAGGNNITLSANTAAGAATISIIDSPAISRWTDWGGGLGFNALSSSGMTQSSASFRAFNLMDAVSFTRVDVPVFVSLATSATANTGNVEISSGFVIYSRAGSALNPIAGAFGTTTYTWASNSSNWSGLTGGKLISFPISTMLGVGEYYFGMQLSTTNNSSIGTATTQLGVTISMLFNSIYTASSFIDMGGTSSASTNILFQGLHTSTITATNQTISMSNITVTGTPFVRANVPIIFRNW